MHEMIMRSRWIIALIAVVTVASIVTYVSGAGSAAQMSQAATSGPQVVISGTPGEAADGDAAPAGSHSGSPDDYLVDRTIGEDVRPEEEKQAEAAAIAAASKVRIELAPEGESPVNDE